MTDGVLECPDCGIRAWDTEEQREEMKAHREECPGESDPRERFEVGDRVQFSDFGRMRLNRDHQEGDVVGFSRKEDHCVRVSWDGNKTAGRYAQAFIKHVEEET